MMLFPAPLVTWDFPATWMTRGYKPDPTYLTIIITIIIIIIIMIKPHKYPSTVHFYFFHDPPQPSHLLWDALGRFHTSALAPLA